MKDMIDSNKKDYDNNMKKLTAYLTRMITSMMDQIKTSKSSPDNKDSQNPPDTTTLVPTNKKAPPLEGVHSTKMGWHVDSQT